MARYMENDNSFIQASPVKNKNFKWSIYAIKIQVWNIFILRRFQGGAEQKQMTVGMPHSERMPTKT